MADTTLISTKAAGKPPLKPKGALARKKKLHLRTRELMRFHCRGLELDIMNLRQEIATLELSRQLLFSRSLNRADAVDGSFVRTVQQFYRLMRHGFHDFVYADESSDRPLDFRQFMRVSFEDAMAVGPDPTKTEPHGRDHLIAYLMHMTALTGAPNVQLLGTRILVNSADSTVTVEVQTVCSSPLSASILERKFAHVSLYPWLRNKLVGRHINAYGDARYVFNAKTGRIISADLQVDHAQAILQLVDSSEDFELLFGNQSAEAAGRLVDRATTAYAPEHDHAVELSPVAQQVVSPPPPPPAMSLSFVLSPESPTWTDDESNDGDAQPVTPLPPR